jgi:outer membrane receptor protein involved in Fe transport
VQRPKVERDTNVALNGTTVLGAARRFADLDIEYTNFLIPRLDMSLQLSYQSRTTAQSVTFELPSYVNTDIFASYRFGEDERATTVRLGVVNALDHYYWTTDGFSFFPAAPRTVRAELSTFF